MKKVDAATAAGKLVGNTYPAAAAAGKMTFARVVPDSGGVLPGIDAGPLKYLFGGLGQLLRGIKEVFRDKKRLVPVLIISVLWLVLLLLPVLGVQSSVVTWLSFLTFARGGTGGGMPGVIGGLLGKCLFACFITAIIVPLFSGSKPFVGLQSGVKTLLGSFAVKEKSAFALLLYGAGAALIAYNFLTGNAPLQNCMAGIAAFFISLRALAGRGGFLRVFISSLFNKIGRGQAPGTFDVTRIMAGWAAGFALGVLLSVTGINAVGYLSGLILILAGVVLQILGRSRKETAAQ